MAGGMAQVVECLPGLAQSPEFKPKNHKKKSKEKKEGRDKGRKGERKDPL
jgi:hypothetical protein